MTTLVRLPSKANAYFTDQQHFTIGLRAESNPEEPLGYLKGLNEAGIDRDDTFAQDDMNFILWHAGVLGDNKIAMEIFGSSEPTEEMKALVFTRKLYLALRTMGKAAMRQEIERQTAGATVVSLKNKSGGRLVIHPATRQDKTSEWQLTTISYDGVPSGHNNPPTFVEAIHRAVGASEDYYWNESGYKYEWSNNLNTKAPI